ncbi:MAG: DHHW family protein [Muribaculaceae bacterium]|nr:DHHW family protein [Roseburia sp.]MCM1429947.1 DHHW family protein [Muribaculaceae bacterium]MCM1493026.1 DHHW family protein [Muribaculaceae bacterium]
MKRTRIVLTILFLAFFVGVSGGSLLVKDREFSPNENRYLAEKPGFSWENVMSGDFQEDLEDYLNDQIVGRDQWITVKTAVQKVTGNTDIGGAYVGKDGYDFEKIVPEDVDDAQVARNIVAVQDFFSRASGEIAPERLSFLLVPTSGLVMEDKLPKNARLFDQNAYIDRVKFAMKDYNFVDVRDELAAHSAEYIYYKTDHHWTTDGACIACEKWCASAGVPYAAADGLEKNVVTTEFRGSLYSKILDADSAYDSIWIYGQQEEPRLEVTVNEKEPGQIYDGSKLTEKDKYAFFFGGNEGQMHIFGGDSGESGERSLLVVKDSFANSFVPLIAGEFEHVYMVDLRYYNGDMQEYLSEHGITDVLVLYNISNFISDKNLYKLSGD